MPAMSVEQTSPLEGPHWFCVRTKRLSEGLSARALRADIGLDVFCPLLRFQKARKTGKVWVQEALFPNYLFAKFDYFENHRRIKATRGVLTILSFGGEPVPVSDSVISELRDVVREEETIIVESSIQAGEEVDVIGGPFQGLRAMVTRVMPAKQRVAILLELLGMEREVEVASDLVLAPKSHPLQQ